MYSIEKKPFGFKLTFSEMVNANEMKKWVDESKNAVSSAPNDFGVLIDMRKLSPLATDAQLHMQEGQKIYKQNGMKRSAVIVSSVLTKMQFQRIAKETGIYDWERYIDASSVNNWEKAALDWIEKEVDPDL
jgi:hypothetical protein